MAAYRGSPLRVLEVWEDQPGTKRLQKNDVSLEHLDNWLESGGNGPIDPKPHDSLSKQLPALRLICCNFGVSSPASGFGTRTLKNIYDGFDLHWTTGEAFVNNNGSCARHFTKDPISGVTSTMHLVVKVPHFVIGSYGLSLVFDIKTRTTQALLYGYTDDDYHHLSEYLNSVPHISLFRNPLLLAGHLMRIYRKNAESYRAKVDECIFRTEMSLGYAVPGALLHESSSASKGKFDFDRFVQKLHLCHDDSMRRLHSCQTELGALSHVGNFGRELGLLLHKTCEKLDAMMRGGELPETNAAFASEYTLHDIDFQTNLWWAMMSQMAVLKERTQTHINLIFSVIAQDENRLSRSVAQKSEMIAAATKKDSAAMKTLAVLTTVFLPPTFVATFFSMTMFDWNSDSEDAHIASRYLWIYWAVAVPLTTLVLIIWRIWWNLEDRKDQAELHKTE